MVVFSRRRVVVRLSNVFYGWFVKLAAIQYRPPKGKPHQAREALKGLISRAGDLGAKLIVCPEMATTGYVWEAKDDLLPHAEDRSGPTYEMVAPLAIKHHAWIVCGFAERCGDSLYNASMVVGPSGRLVACYRKVFLYETDVSWATPGDERMVISTDFGGMTVGICMDINDPDFLHHLHGSDAKVFSFCTNWIDEGVEVHPYWRWRLSGWDGWTVAANSWGEDGDVTFSGCSAVLSPAGRVLAACGRTGDDVVVAETSPDFLDIASASGVLRP